MKIFAILVSFILPTFILAAECESLKKLHGNFKQATCLDQKELFPADLTFGGVKAVKGRYIVRFSNGVATLFDLYYSDADCKNLIGVWDRVYTMEITQCGDAGADHSLVTFTQVGDGSEEWKEMLKLSPDRKKLYWGNDEKTALDVTPLNKVSSSEIFKP